MRCIVFTFVIAVLFQVQAVAQNGHYITWEGDTVLVDINIPKTFPGEENFEKLFKEVKVVSLNGNQYLFKPGEIAGFSFLHRKKQYTFDTQQRPRYQFITHKLLNTVPSFLLRIEKGKSGAAHYKYENSTGEGSSDRIEYYTFSRSIDHQLLFLQNGDSYKVFRRKLKGFYAFIPGAEKATKKKFGNHKKMRRDIQNFMLAINKA